MRSKLFAPSAIGSIPGVPQAYGLRFSPIVARFPDDGGEGGDGGDGGGSADDKKVDMTQAALDELVKRKQGEAASKAQKEAKKLLDELNAKIAELSKKPEKKAEDEERRYTQAELQELLTGKEKEYNDRHEETAKRLNKVLADNKLAAITNAAVLAKAINPAAVSKLVADNIGTNDDGKLVVLKEDGSPRLDSRGNDMQVQEFIAEFLEANPYLKQGSGVSGAGSGSSNHRKDADKNLTAEQRLTAFFAGKTSQRK